MGSFTITQRVHAPPAVVFDIATDLEHAAQHIDGIEKIELLSPGPIGKGTRWRETRVMFGKESSEEMEVTEFDPPHSYSAAAESCGCRYDFTFRFHPEGEATKVELVMQWKAVSMLAKLMSPLAGLMIGPMKKCIQQDLENLKLAAELQSTSSA